MAKRQKSAKSEKPQYEKRIILFLDFLGFKEIVEGTAGDPARLANLLKAIDRLYDTANQGLRGADFKIAIPPGAPTPDGTLFESLVMALFRHGVRTW